MSNRNCGCVVECYLYCATRKIHIKPACKHIETKWNCQGVHFKGHLLWVGNQCNQKLTTVFVKQNEPQVINGEKSIISLNHTRQYSECVTITLLLSILTAKFYSLQAQTADSKGELCCDKLFLTLGNILSYNCCTKVTATYTTILLLYLLIPGRGEYLSQWVHSCKLQSQCKLHSEVWRGA